MKILYITSDSSILEENSASRLALIELAHKLEALHVVVLSSHKKGKGVSKIEPNIWLYSTNSRIKPLAPYEAYILAVFNTVWQGKAIIDLVVSDGGLQSTAVAYFVSGRIRRRFVVFLSVKIDESQTRGWKGRIYRRLLERVYQIYVTSERVRHSVMSVSASAEGKIVQLPSFIDVSSFRNSKPTFSLKVRYPDYKFFLIAAIGEEKEEKKLASETFKLCAEAFPFMAVIVIDGRSNSGDLFGGAQKLRNIFFEEPSQDLASYFKTANMLFFASSAEDDDTILVGAVASGCPTLSIESPLASKIITDGQNGFVCGMSDAHCIVEKIRQVVNDNHIREYIRINASEILVDNIGLSKDDYYETLRSHWKEATEKKD